MFALKQNGKVFQKCGAFTNVFWYGVKCLFLKFPEWSVDS